MVRIVFLLMISLFLGGCAKHPKKVFFDRNSQIDAELNADEYVSSGERIHAKELADQLKQQREVFAESTGSSMHIRLANPEIITLYEAKCADIPIPIDCKPLKEYFNPKDLYSQDIVLGYSSSLSIKELRDFYQNQMPVFGWNQRASFMGQEHLLIFEKYNQLCILQMRRHDGWFYEQTLTHLTLFLSDQS